MSRIAEAFVRMRSERRAALVPYVCAGDPSLEATPRLVSALVAAGADLIEIGVPFSDPIADGPTIQAASGRALANGTTPRKVFEVVAQIRSDGIAVPIVLMGYLNPMLSLGLDAFCAEAAGAGADGLIVCDLPVDEAEPVQRAAGVSDLDLILLAAPTTTPERLARIGAETRGFLYFVSVAGVTGARVELPAELPAQLLAARQTSRVPVAVGFGISTPEQARQLARHADAIVVGSAIVRLLVEPDGIVRAAALVAQLASALR